MSSKRPPSGAHPDAAAAKRTPALPWAAEMLDGADLANLQSSLASVYSPPVSPPAQDAVQPAPASSVVDLTISDDEGGGATDEDEGGGGGDSPAPPEAGGAAQPTEYSLEDDDIEIVVPGPRKAASPVASGSPTELGDDDDVIVALSSGSAIECMPHARSDCVVHRFRAPVPGVCNECDNAKVCPQCYCYVCDVPAPCKQWRSGDHCDAIHTNPRWQKEREAHKQAKLIKPAPSPSPRRRAAAPTGTSPKVVQAQSYVALVKRTLGSQSVKWRQFLEILRRFREDGEKSSFVRANLQPLLADTPQLLPGLAQFLG